MAPAMKIELMKHRLQGPRADLASARIVSESGRRLEASTALMFFFWTMDFSIFNSHATWISCWWIDSRQLKDELLLPAGLLREPIVRLSVAPTSWSFRGQVNRASPPSQFATLISSLHLLRGNHDYWVFARTIGSSPGTRYATRHWSRAILRFLRHRQSGRLFRRPGTGGTCRSCGRRAFRDHHRYSAT